MQKGANGQGWFGIAYFRGGCSSMKVNSFLHIEPLQEHFCRRRSQFFDLKTKPVATLDQAFELVFRKRPYRRRSWSICKTIGNKKC